MFRGPGSSNDYSHDQEFARCTIDSGDSKSGGSGGGQKRFRKDRDDSGNEDETTRSSARFSSKDALKRTKRYPDYFRGTGQNGQILKEDMLSWSRRLHAKTPPNIYQRVKIPYKSIIIVSAPEAWHLV